MLESIPELPMLTSLTCELCTNLKLISQLKSIYIINCSNCRLLTIVKSTPFHYFKYNGCYWLNKYNINKLIVLQKYYKKWSKYRTLKKWVDSGEFNKWYYSPGNMGSFKALYHIEKVSKILN